MIIIAARTVDTGVTDVQENESWDSLTIHLVPLIRYMGIATEGQQMLREEADWRNRRVIGSLHGQRVRGGIELSYEM